LQNLQHLLQLGAVIISFINPLTLPTETGVMQEKLSIGNFTTTLAVGGLVNKLKNTLTINLLY